MIASRLRACEQTELGFLERATRLSVSGLDPLQVARLIQADVASCGILEILAGYCVVGFILCSINLDALSDRAALTSTVRGCACVSAYSAE